MAQSHPEAVAFRLLFSWASLKLVATYNRVTCKSIVISSRNCVDSIELASHFLRRLLMVPNIPDWANSMTSVVPLQSNHGPSVVCRLAGAGPIPCYWHGLFREGLGQLKATSSLALEQLWANSMLLAMPVSREAGSIPCYWYCIFRGGLGQLNAISSPASQLPWAISIMLFSTCWANPMLFAWSLSRVA